MTSTKSCASSSEVDDLLAAEVVDLAGRLVARRGEEERANRVVDVVEVAPLRPLAEDEQLGAVEQLT